MPPTTSLIFDIETRADADLLAATGYAATDGEMLPPIFHLPVAIAVGHMTSEGILTSVESLADDLLGQDDPRVLTEDFWAMANHAPVWISYNGRSFDIPVLELCAMRYGCVALKHWQDQYGTRYRYGKAHLDLYDILSNYGAAPTKGLTLSHLVQLLGYQGKAGVDGSKVQAMWEAGELDAIREYNRLDCVRTFAVYLQYAHIAGRLTEEVYQRALQASKPWLDAIREHRL
jgi:predicted PolB exonuclease-like 3'-5' exonuclease